MYNGIGLLTPRGSGTSGYVSANKFNLRRAPVQNEQDRKATEGLKTKKPNEEILLHKRKREIEVRLLELRVRLEDEDKLPPERIDEMLAMERAVLEERFISETSEMALPLSTAQETHEVAKRKMEQMERFRRALGIKGNVKEGEAFDSELQEQRKKEAAMRREEAERRRVPRDEKKRYDGAEITDRARDATERRRRDDRHRSRETRKSRESLERERSQPRGPGKRKEVGRSRERYEQRGDRWMGEPEKFQNNRDPLPIVNEGRNAWQDDRRRPYYNQRHNYDDGPPPDSRYYDQDRPPFRGRYYERMRYSRGHGRRFLRRGSRPYDMGGPGYYRIGETAPERYDPADVPADAHPGAGQRWQKVDLDAVEEQEKPREEEPNTLPEDQTHRVGAYIAEYDAHGALSGKERGKESSRPRHDSPPPRSSNSKSPPHLKTHRRPPEYRPEARSDSPPREKDEKRELTRQKASHHSPNPRDRSLSPKERGKEHSRRGGRHRSRSLSRSHSPAKSEDSSHRSDKSKGRSSSRSASLDSRRSGRDRRRDRSMERRRRPSPRRYYDSRTRRPDYRRGGHGRHRGMDSYRGGGYRPDYRGYRRGGYNPYGGNWRSDRRHDRRMSRSRSRDRRRRSRSFSRSRSSSSSSDDRSRRSSSLSKGRSSDSDKGRRTDSRSPAPSKAKS